MKKKSNSIGSLAVLYKNKIKLYASTDKYFRLLVLSEDTVI
jgi:hypothetical protein